MEFLRNTFGVLLGLTVALVIITLGIRLNPEWVTYKQLAPFSHWDTLLRTVEHKPFFFVALLFSSGVASTVGGIVAALIVKHAKVAYALLIGFILLFVALLDIIVYPYHPTFYKITIFLVFFPFAWVGGKFVEIFFDRKKRYYDKNGK